MLSFFRIHFLDVIDLEGRVTSRRVSGVLVSFLLPLSLLAAMQPGEAAGDAQYLSCKP